MVREDDEQVEPALVTSRIVLFALLGLLVLAGLVLVALDLAHGDRTAAVGPALGVAGAALSGSALARRRRRSSLERRDLEP